MVPPLRTKLFLVEDHPVMLTGLEAFIADTQDFSVVGTALTGAEALKKLPATNPDLVLLDISLPDIDGLQLCAMLKDSYPKIKVAIFTGHQEDRYYQEACKLRVDAYIVKGSAWEEVLQQLRRVARN